MLVEFLNYSATIARNLGRSPNRGGDIVYYARHRVGKGGGLVLAPAVTRVLVSAKAEAVAGQVLRSQDFYISINSLFLAFFKEGGSTKS